MKKNILLRCLIGAPLGLAISTIITIVISVATGDGTYYAVVPELIGDCGGELNAVILQSVLSFLYGAAWAGATAIWEIERFSITKQTILHLVICSAATLPIAYFCRWMPHNGQGIAIYFGTFIAVYCVIWLVLYTGMKRRIRQLNEKIAGKN